MQPCASSFHLKVVLSVFGGERNAALARTLRHLFEGNGAYSNTRQHLTAEHLLRSTHLSLAHAYIYSRHPLCHLLKFMV